MREFYLTKRDQQILQFLHENKVALRDHIHEKFFSGVTVRILNRRLAQILKHGYILRGVIFVKSKALSCYQLTTKGFKFLEKQKEFQSVFKTENSESIEHDLSLIFIRKIFSFKKRVIKYLTENMLNCDSTYTEDKKYKYFIDLQSDAVCDVQFSKGNFHLAVEYESEPKANSRYEEKFIDYYNTSIEGVIYICECKHLMRKLKEIDRRICESKKLKSRIFFCSMEDLKNSGQRISFTNSLDHAISID